MFETEVGLIIAYSRAHAEDMARSVLEEREPDLEVVNQMQELFY